MRGHAPTRLRGRAAGGDDAEALAEAFGGARDGGDLDPVDGRADHVVVGGGRALDGGGDCGDGKDAAVDARHVEHCRAGGVEEVIAVAAVAEALGAVRQQLRGQGVQRTWVVAGQARLVE